MSRGGRASFGRGRPLNRPRRNILGLLALGLALATAGRARAQEASPAKVHGTITVDFDTVTIAELLKLVDVVEKVDGTIHIVSSKPGDGENALVVSGANGAIALTRADQPAAPKVVIGPAKPAAPAVASVPVQVQSPAAPRLPPLASLGRLLGLGRQPTQPAPVASSAAPAPAAEGAKVIPLETPEPSGPPVVESAPPVALDSGTLLGSLVEGSSLVVGPFHSPWPKSEARAKPARDAEVSQAGGEQAAASPAARKQVVAGGDSFETLARKHYGDARYARALWWANRDRVAWPDAPVDGKRLVVPGLGELEPRMVLAGKKAPAAIPALEPIGPRRDPEAVAASFTEGPPEPASEDLGGVAVHVVRPDDTLRIIAREKCGDERKALEIMALNRDALSKDGRPRVGQCLILPAPAAKP